MWLWCVNLRFEATSNIGSRVCNKVIHVLQCANFPFPYEDWDEGFFSIEEYRRRYKRVEREMLVSSLVTSGFSILTLIPIWFMGK